MTIISNSEGETFDFGRKLGKKIEKGGVICLFGDLGTGKTTLTKAIAQYFGISKIKIKSPTYTYMREHSGKNNEKIYHIDLYRLNGTDELLVQEIQELLEDKSNIVLIEWADRLEEYLPSERVNIYLDYIDENRRSIKIV